MISSKLINLNGCQEVRRVAKEGHREGHVEDERRELSLSGYSKSGGVDVGEPLRWATMLIIADDVTACRGVNPEIIIDIYCVEDKVPMQVLHIYVVSDITPNIENTSACDI